jgi:hypothetical protein
MGVTPLGRNPRWRHLEILDARGITLEPIVQIIEPYIEDCGAEPRICQRAVFSSRAKCNAEIVLRDEHGEDQFLCRPHAAQELRANLDLLARAVIDIALMAKRPP